MADITNGPKQLNSKQEPPMEKRLLLAFLLMAAVLFATPYFYRLVNPPRPVKPAPPAAAVVAKPAETAAAQPPAAPESPAEAAAPVAPAQATSATREDLFTIETSLYRVVLSNRGGVVRSWVLKKFKTGAGTPLELVSAPGAAKTGYPFALTFRDKAPALDVNQALYTATPAPGGLGVDYDFSDGKVAVHKSFRFDRNSYLSQVSSRVSQNGVGIPNLFQWRGGFGDAAVPAAASRQRIVFWDATGGKLHTEEAKSAKDGPVTESGNYSFAGIEDTYFAAVFSPHGTSSFVIRTVSDTVPGAVDKAEAPHAGAEVGGAAENEFSLFVGPKDLDLLRKIDPRLEQMVDFGWFSLLAKPLFFLLNWLNDNLVHNYGWAIVLATILINFALLPMRLSSMKSMKRMQALKPQVDVINAKYKNVGLRDPKKAEQNAEVMELYKKHGVNPMGGCLPMVIQIPFFIAFYKVLTVAIEMRGASWLWVHDLSQPEQLAIRILPVAMIVAQFVMQKMTPNPSADPNQQRVMMLMPLIFGFMFYSVSSGLVLYWLTSNLVGIVQQWFINRSMPDIAPQPAVTSATKKGGSRR
ncbi:MAG TPA: membrane protein insertase YidC [Bryobacteraceae bacterium]